MFAMRLKLGSIRNNEWRSWFCLHVRTATIVFGIWHLVLHILALTVLALIMRNHHVIVQRHNEFEQNDFLPTPLSKIKNDDNPYYLPTTQDGPAIYPSDIDMGALMTVCTLSITLLMVYGTIKGKATHLLPFFCLQLFDFAITTLTATGYFCYLRSVHRLVAEHWNLPFRHELLQLSPQILSLIVLSAFLISMLWKAYWISVIWRCYKYLTLRQQTMRNTIHYIVPEGSERATDPDYPSFFRDQETGFGGVMKQTPPPSYQDIMEQPPPYPAGLQTEMGHDGANRLRFLVFYPNGAGDASPSYFANAEDGTASIASTSRVEASIEVVPTSNNNAEPETAAENESPLANEQVTTPGDEKVGKVEDGNVEVIEGAAALPPETAMTDDDTKTLPNTPKM